MERHRVMDILAEITGRAAPACEITRLPPDASARTYYRIQLTDGASADGARSLILMDLGPDGGRTPDEATSGPTPAELPFINVLRHLQAGGLAVPRLHHHDEAAGLLFLEDFGEVLLEQEVVTAGAADRRPLYDRAIAQLVDLQAHTATHPDPACVGYQRGFDHELLRWELEHFKEWILDARDVALDPAEAASLSAHFDRLADAVAALPRIFVHRDYQSRNLMVCDDGRLGILDFQDALLGPRPYDLVALLRDSYVVLAPDEVEWGIARYLELAAAAGLDVDPDTFGADFALVTLQRKLKDAGRFVFIDQVKGNPNFLRHVPASLSYVDWALDRLPAYADLAGLLRARVPELNA